MSKTITITIGKAAVVEAIKGDTAITGSIDRSIDAVKNAGVAYNETAGDDAHHEKKIERMIRGAVSKFEAEIAEFADGSEGSISDSLTGDNIIIRLVVSDRYNGGLGNPLSGLAQEYIINMSLYAWWNSIKPDFAKGFITLAADALAYVRKCFVKQAPAAAASSYEAVTGTVIKN